MSDLRARAAVFSIRAAIGRIRDYLDGVDFERFIASELLQDAVSLNLLVIGEGVARLPDRQKAAVPEIPWQRITDLRNRIAHGYDSLEFPLIWVIATEELGGLEAAIDAMAGPT